MNVTIVHIYNNISLTLIELYPYAYNYIIIMKDEQSAQ